MTEPLKSLESVQDEYVKQVLSASDRVIMESKEVVELRVVACDTCGGDGRFLDEVCAGYGRVICQETECRACGGTGARQVEFRSLSCADLDQTGK